MKFYIKNQQEKRIFVAKSKTLLLLARWRSVLQLSN